MEIKEGLRPNPPDNRDLRVFDGKLGAGIYGQPTLEELPSEFLLSPIFQYDQGDTDTCSAQATGGASSIQEGTKLHALSSFGFGKLISGDPEAWGQDHRTACKAHVKFGAIPEKDLPLDLFEKDASFWRDPSNWANRADELFRLAAPYRKGSFMAVTGRYDAFDDIRTTIWKFREGKRAVTFGLQWAFDTGNPVIDELRKEGFGHLVYIYGWVVRDGKTMLVMQNSWGEGVGDHGKFYLASREEVNEMAEIYGLYMFEDLPAEVAKYYQENGSKIEDNWSILTLKSLQKAAVDLLGKLVALLTFQVAKTGAPVPSKWFYAALAWQESDVTPSIVGDKHLSAKAYGIFQIRQPYMTDVYPMRRAEECMGNVPLSLDVVKKYIARYANENRLGRPVTDQDIARIHNGGPTGWKRNTTLIYWYEFKQKLKALENGTAPAPIVERLKRYGLYPN